MNPLGRLAQGHTPEFARKWALAQLFAAAAAAFECDAPPPGRLSHKERLEQFAEFTRSHVETLLSGRGDLEAVQGRLYRDAWVLGRRCGRLLGIRSVEDTMDMGRVLYRILDIEFQGDARGEVLISRCHFSRFYSPGVCRIMSAMDRGMLAGLSNGGQLVFLSRITEGQACCRAHFTSGGAET